LTSDNIYIKLATLQGGLNVVFTDL
jgi:hypothetical protein